MKRRAIVVALAVSAGALMWAWPREPGIVRSLERAIEADLPRGIAVEYTDTHGGFHGDGELRAVVTFADPDQAKGFRQEVSGRWSLLPVDGAVLREVRRLWPELPEPEEGYWMYRDRFFEQYGRRCDLNPVLQNCTFALLDPRGLTLYVFQSDF